MPASSQDEQYQSAAAEFGRALERLARGYEADAERRRDLLQDIHLALWRSFALFDGRCSTRTWVYRVAHNAAADHVLQRKRAKAETPLDLDDLERQADATDIEAEAGTHQALERLTRIIRRLKPPDAQVMLLYLEDLDAAAIAEITGLSAGSVATRIHRIKAYLAKQFREGGRHD